MKNIADIAKIAGVSKSTVSRYLNNGSVSTKTKEKLDAIIRQYDYQPNQFAQSLRAHKTNMIGAIIPRMNSYAVDETIKGVKNLCDSLNYRLLLNYTNLDPALEIDALETFYRSKVDGIIFMATDLTDKHLEVINKINVPVVIVGQHFESFHCIVHDDYHAGYLVGDLIGQRGYRHIKYFSVTEHDTAVGIKRKNGLIDGLKQYHVTPDVTTTSFNFKEAMIDVQSELHKDHSYDVIIGATDAIGLAVHKFCTEHQLSFDQRMIVGFGGDPMTQLVSPVINTVIYHFEAAGEVAMSQLDKLIKHQSVEEKILIDVELSFK